MKGTVDEDLRALINVHVGGLPNGQKSTVVVWIDTAFNGGLDAPKVRPKVLGPKENWSILKAYSPFEVSLDDVRFLRTRPRLCVDS